MGPSERLFKVEYAKELLRIAQADLESAVALTSTTRGRRENIIFLSQQSVEKAIKAVVCARKIPVPLSHDILVLLAKLPLEDYPPGGTQLSDLTPFATIRRYEEGPYDLTDEEVKAALNAAGAVIAWAQEKIKV